MDRRRQEHRQAGQSGYGRQQAPGTGHPQQRRGHGPVGGGPPSVPSAIRQRAPAATGGGASRERASTEELVAAAADSSQPAVSCARLERPLFAQAQLARAQIGLCGPASRHAHQPTKACSLMPTRTNPTRRRAAWPPCSSCTRRCSAPTARWRRSSGCPPSGHAWWRCCGTPSTLCALRPLRRWARLARWRRRPPRRSRRSAAWPARRAACCLTGCCRCSPARPAPRAHHSPPSSSGPSFSPCATAWQVTGAARMIQGCPALHHAYLRFCPVPHMVAGCSAFLNWHQLISPGRLAGALCAQACVHLQGHLPAGVDAVTLARYANAVFEACQGLLEAEATSPQLVPPLLEVVMQASYCSLLRHVRGLLLPHRSLAGVLGLLCLSAPHACPGLFWHFGWTIAVFALWLNQEAQFYSLDLLFCLLVIPTTPYTRTPLPAACAHPGYMLSAAARCLCAPTHRLASTSTR